MSPIGSVRAGVRGVPLDAIPDSVVYSWPIQEGSGSTATDVVGNADLTLASPTWDSDTNSIDGQRLLFDGSSDEATSNATKPAGSFTMLTTIEPTTDINKIAEVQAFVSSSGASGSVGEAELRFRGDQSTNRLDFAVQNDSTNAQSVSVDGEISSNVKQRVVGILDASVPEIKIAVNGSIVATNTATGTFQEQKSNHTVASDGFGDQRYLPAYVDEPIVANKAYSSQEITDDYQRQPWS
jgi:hypothetical protein